MTTSEIQTGGFGLAKRSHTQSVGSAVALVLFHTVMTLLGKVHTLLCAWVTLVEVDDGTVTNVVERRM